MSVVSPSSTRTRLGASSAAVCGLLGMATSLPGCEAAAKAESTAALSRPKPAASATRTPASLVKSRRSYFSLAAHPERSSLYEGDTQVFSFGGPAAAMYTFGGWRTGTGHQASIRDGDTKRTVLVVRRSRTDLFIPFSDSSQRMGLRLRPCRKTRVKLSLNGQKIHETESLAPDRFHTIWTPIDAKQVSGGDNVIRVQGAGTREVAGLGQCGFVLDWMRIGSSEGGALRDQPPQSNLFSQKNGRPALTLQPGTRVAFHLEVPPGARFVTQANASAQTSRLLLRIVSQSVKRGRTSLNAQELLRQDVHRRSKGSVGTSVQTLNADLSAYQGQVIRLELSASGSMTLIQPRIVQAIRTPALAEGTRPRNVLIYLIDTLRADKLTPFEPRSRVKTPALAQLAAKAAVFHSAHTQENWTKPSVATLLSSLFPWQHHATSMGAVVPKSVKLLPEVLKERGFTTAAFIANGYVSDKFGFKQGWARYRNYIREGRRTRAQYVADDVLQWLDRRPKEKPFFLYVHTIDPHVPYRPTPFLSLYDELDYSGVVNFRKDSTLLEKIKGGSIRLSRRDKRRLEALYDSEVSYHDRHFHRIFKGLKERGLEDNTLVVVTADHGEEFWDHGSVGHGHSVFEELLRIPLVIRFPPWTQGSQHLQQAVGLVDIAPTVLDALGVSAPAEFSGDSLLPLLRNTDSGHAPAPRVAVSGFMDGWRAATSGHYKLIQRTERRAMLYDLGKDPGETTNLAEQQPLTLRYLRGLLGLSLNASKQRARKARSHHKAQRTDIDPKTKAQLRALGYVK